MHKDITLHLGNDVPKKKLSLNTALSVGICITPANNLQMLILSVFDDLDDQVQLKHLSAHDSAWSRLVVTGSRSVLFLQNNPHEPGGMLSCILLERLKTQAPNRQSARS